MNELIARTENGALTNATSLSAMLDFFGLAGAMRNNIADATKLFKAAYAEDPQTAMRILFYLRDIRGGQGERTLFRELFKIAPPTTQHALLELIPEYGRWDDLFAVTSVENYAGIVAKQLAQDRQSERPSLMAKWLPSENASSAASRKSARALATALGLTQRQYRKMVVSLRQRVGLLETKMSSQAWHEIDYGHIPSQAGRKYTRAFQRNDQDRYQSFIDSVNRGEATVNSGTLFTYEIYNMVNEDWTGSKDDVANALWKNLPDHTNGSNALVMADVSGSMRMNDGLPMAVSVSLAIYFAERNKGPFQDYFMTFTDRPELIKISDGSLREKINIVQSHVGYNTNIAAAFDAILAAAVKSNATQDQLPGTLYVISDMEFDNGTYINGTDATAFNRAAERFNRAGYELPHIVFWNVAARNTNTPVTKNDSRVTLISGSSQSTFRYVVEGKSPLELMLEVINSDRYARVVVPGSRVVSVTGRTREDPAYQF